MFRLALVLPLVTTLHASVGIDIEAFGKSLGGWNVKAKSACDYDLSGSGYRTYKPELTPTPDGGVFASVRIDHRRGWLASDDHAVLEVTISKEGTIASAQSNLALQGRTISSDVIRTGGAMGGGVPGVGAAVKVGADLTADLSSKLLREKVVEPGRVNFPSAVRHNYNLLFQAIRTNIETTATTPAQPQGTAAPVPAPPPAPEAKPAEAKKEEPKKEEPKKEEPKKEEAPKPAASESSKLEVKAVSGDTIQLKK